MVASYCTSTGIKPFMQNPARNHSHGWTLRAILQSTPHNKFHENIPASGAPFGVINDKGILDALELPLDWPGRLNPLVKDSRHVAIKGGWQSQGHPGLQRTYWSHF